MNWRALLPAAKAALPYVLGAMGMVGIQNTVPTVKESSVGAAPQTVKVELAPLRIELTPQVFNLKPVCPSFNVQLEQLTGESPHAR